MRSWSFNETYKFNLNAFIGISYSDFKLELEEMGIESKSKVSEGLTLEYFKGNNGPNYILYSRKRNYGVIAHEALHIANFLFEYHNIEVSNDEATCYLVEWIVNAVINKSNRY